MVVGGGLNGVKWPTTAAGGVAGCLPVLQQISTHRLRRLRNGTWRNVYGQQEAN